MATILIHSLPTPAPSLNKTAGKIPSALQKRLERIRADFPILATQVHGKPLVYLDSAATTQKPLAVIERMQNYYAHENANIHRGVYYLSEQATAAYEEVRKKVKEFLHARADREIVFVRGTTEAINLVASSYGGTFLKKGDEILISEMEHHSNIVPWQILCERSGIHLKALPMNDVGELRLEELDRLLTEKTRLVAVTQLSNALGTINPIKMIIEKAHGVGAKVLIDGAQAVSHLPVDVQELDCDFYAFSGHKIFGPTGIGVLYA
jgi:cysteine desulfurase/selenocysteine lyase